jgi:hypothetical protein
VAPAPRIAHSSGTSSVLLGGAAALCGGKLIRWPTKILWPCFFDWCCFGPLCAAPTPDIGMPSFGKVGGERSGWISCWRNMPGGGGSRCREEGKASLAVFLCLIAELQVILMVCACRSVSWAITRESNCGPMSPRQPNGHI